MVVFPKFTDKAPSSFVLGEARFTQLKASYPGDKVTFCTAAAPRATTLIVYGDTPPEIFKGRTEHDSRFFVVLVVKETGETTFSGRQELFFRLENIAIFLNLLNNDNLFLLPCTLMTCPETPPEVPFASTMARTSCESADNHSS